MEEIGGSPKDSEGGFASLLKEDAPTADTGVELPPTPVWRPPMTPKQLLLRALVSGVASGATAFALLSVAWLAFQSYAGSPTLP
jgi:hypothetical protein